MALLAPALVLALVVCAHGANSALPRYNQLQFIRSHNR